MHFRAEDKATHPKRATMANRERDMTGKNGTCNFAFMADMQVYMGIAHGSIMVS